MLFMLVTEKPSISWSAIEKITDGRGLIMRYLALLSVAIEPAVSRECSDCRVTF